MRNTPMLFGFFSILLAAPSAFPQWTKLDGGPGTGAIQVLVAEGGRLWAGTGGLGLYRSDDTGSSWSKTAGLPGDITSFLSIEGILFAGSRSGLFRSRDAGSSWTLLERGPVEPISCLFAEGRNVFASGDIGPLMFSNDAGETWSAPDTGMTAVRTLLRDGELLWAGGYHGIRVSDDSGKTWRPSATAFDKPVNALTASGGQIYAGTAYDGVYRTRDGGRAWSAVSAGMRSGAGAVNALAVQGNSVFAATRFLGLLRGFDPDGSWSAANGNLVPGEILALAAMGRALFMGTATAGLFRSDDAGNTWAPADGMLPPGWVSSWLGSGDTCLAGFNSPGRAYRSLDQGKTWLPASTGLPIGVYDNVFLPLLSDRGTFWAALNRGLARSRDGGAGWTQVTNGISGAIVQAMARTASGVLYAGATGDNDAGPWQGGVFRSLDNGNSWTQANAGIEWKPVKALAVRAESVFIGSGKGFYRSGDRGMTWIPMNAGLADSSGNDLALFQGKLFAATGSGIFRADNQYNWSPMGQALPQAGIRVLEIAGGQLYAAGYSGLMYRYHAEGDSWVPIRDDPPVAGVPYPAIQSIGKCGDDLLVGAEREIWRRPFSQTVGIAHSRSREISGPRLVRGRSGAYLVFNPSAPASVELRVWDASGRASAVLPQCVMPAGEQRLRIPESSRAGLRIVRLRVGSQATTLRIPPD